MRGAIAAIVADAMPGKRFVQRRRHGPLWVVAPKDTGEVLGAHRRVRWPRRRWRRRKAGKLRLRLFCRRRLCGSRGGRSASARLGLGRGRRLAAPLRRRQPLVQREFKAGSTDFAKRVLPEDQARLVRDRLYLLKA